MAVLGLRGTGDMGTDERPKDFREMILWRNPEGDAPIFALTSKTRKRVVTDPEYSWWDEPQDLVRLQVAGTGVNDATSTLVTVDSQDPDANDSTRTYGTAEHLKAGDLLLCETTDTSAYAQEIVEVVNVISATQFVISRGAAGTTPAAIPNDTYLTLIGSAYPEGTPAPQAVSRNPIKYMNKTQIFKDTYELTGTIQATKMRTGEPWSNDKKRKMFDHSRAIELSMLFGKLSETVGYNGKPKRTMNGLRAQIPSGNQYVYSGGTTVFNFMDVISKVFNYVTPAGNERAAFVGNGALNALNKIIAADGNGDIQWKGMEKVYGMNFRELVFPQGRLLLKTHPLLSRFSTYTNSMFVLDMASVTYVTLKGRDTKVKDDVQDDDEDVRRGFIQTECSVELDRGGVTSAYVGNINYAP